MREMVLYYTPEKTDKVRRIKSVLVRMGIRIRNIDESQTGEQVGYLAGMDGFSGDAKQEAEGTAVPVEQEMLVLIHFTQRRLDELLKNLRRADASVALKAVATETNCTWSFSKLYEEIKKEHEMMMQQRAAGMQENTAQDHGNPNGSEK